MFRSIRESVIKWMTHEEPSTDLPMCDYERIRYELRPCDVILTEGRSRVSEVISQITQSPWTHACLYIGRLHDVDDPVLRKKLAEHFKGDPDVQLVVEGYLGQGTIASPLDNYKTTHIRICRPTGLSRRDAQAVIAYAINKLGTDYDMRQLLDLARFLLPWSFFPRRWRSTLFEHHAGPSTKAVCSTMIAEAFAVIDFPILPVVKRHEETGIELFARNPRILTPRDFDYSPYFEIIKYPFISFTEGPYRYLPWNRRGLYSPDGESIHDPNKPVEEPKKISLRDRFSRKKEAPAKKITVSESSEVETEKPKKKDDSDPENFSFVIPNI